MNSIKDALEILKILKKNNYEGYIIGGYPRDLLLGKNTKDIDICTNAKYKQLKKIFDEIEDNKYGSYKLEFKNKEYEITTYRKEIKYEKNRFPKKIKYVNTLKQDLKRRDFVMNTLCINENGEYIDLLNATEDIRNKTIKLIGRKSKIKDDSLRILRAIRFATTLNFKIDKKLEKAIIKYREYLENLSYDRKKQELEKIFTDKNAKYGISLIKKYELEKYLKIDLNNLVLTKNIYGIWAQILTDESYNFKKEEYKIINRIIKLKQKKFNLYDLYKYGPKILTIVTQIKKENIDIEKEYEKLPIKDRDEININFFEICELIEVSNSLIAKIYEDLEKQIIHNKLKNKNASIKKYIKEKY